MGSSLCPIIGQGGTFFAFPHLPTAGLLKKTLPKFFHALCPAPFLFLLFNSQNIPQLFLCFSKNELQAKKVTTFLPFPYPFIPKPLFPSENHEKSASFDRKSPL
jgi:hypothetical protein